MIIGDDRVADFVDSHTIEATADTCGVVDDSAALDPHVTKRDARDPAPATCNVAADRTAGHECQAGGGNAATYSIRAVVVKRAINNDKRSWPLIEDAAAVALGGGVVPHDALRQCCVATVIYAAAA